MKDLEEKTQKTKISLLSIPQGSYGIRFDSSKMRVTST